MISFNTHAAHSVGLMDKLLHPILVASECKLSFLVDATFGIALFVTCCAILALSFRMPSASINAGAFACAVDARPWEKDQRSSHGAAKRHRVAAASPDRCPDSPQWCGTASSCSATAPVLREGSQLGALREKAGSPGSVLGPCLGDVCDHPARPDVSDHGRPSTRPASKGNLSMSSTLSDDDDGLLSESTTLSSCSSDCAPAGADRASPQESPGQEALNARQALRQLLQAEVEMFSQAGGVVEEERTHKAVRRQLLADACRARYIIDGREYWFDATQQQQQQQQQQQAMLASPRTVCRGPCSPRPSFSRRDGPIFAETLVAAVGACLRRRRRKDGVADETSGGSSIGAPSSGAMVHLVMLLLTQIGFVLNHIACGTSELALCGGERSITYTLARRRGCRTWDLRGDFRAYGFSQCQGSGGEVDCSPASSVHRGFAVTLTLSSGHPAGLFIEVGEAYEERSIFDTDGLPTQLSQQWQHEETQARVVRSTQEASSTSTVQSAWLWAEQVRASWTCGANYGCASPSTACVLKEPLDSDVFRNNLLAWGTSYACSSPGIACDLEGPLDSEVFRDNSLGVKRCACVDIVQWDPRGKIRCACGRPVC